MRPHRTDLLSLVPGLLLTAVAVLALADGLDLELLSAEWAWPVLLVALGVVVLASAGWGRRPPTEPPPDDVDDNVDDAAPDATEEPRA